MSRNCEDTAVRIEKELLNSASFLTKIKIKLHLLKCKGCEEYKNKSLVLHKLLCVKKADKNQFVKLTEKEKQELISKLD
jgi:hypothetical protein